MRLFLPLLLAATLSPAPSWAQLPALTLEQLPRPTMPPGEKGPVVPAQVERWREEIVPLRLKLGFTLGGAWVDREHNQFIWLISYDGPETFTERNALYWAAPEREAMGLAPDHYLISTEERTVEAVDFAPKGLRIAVARYNGVTLHWVGTSGAPVDLDWKGAHTGVTFSPDGRFIVTMMQESALHGWKLDGKSADTRHMRMTGYPAKVKSLSWSPKGKWLASSGAPAAIVWPFAGKDGPMGKAPLELGTRANILVTQVAFHPMEEVLAIGFVDGMILAVRIADGKEALLRRPGKGAITSLAWSSTGKLLAFGSEAGDCGVIDITG